MAAIHDNMPKRVVRAVLAPLIMMILFFLGSLSFADTQDVFQLFQDGLKFYSEKKYEDARKSFEQALLQDPNNPSLTYNLGLTLVELKQVGPAAAYLRKAKELDPASNDVEKAWQFFTQKFRIPEMPRQLSSWDIFTQSLRSIPIIILYLFAFLSTALFGALLLKWVKFRRSNTDLSPSPLPLFLSIAFVCVACFFYGVQLYDRSQARGTILNEQVSVKATHEDDASEITQFMAGMEVRVLEQRGDWLKIQYPGSFSGWVKADSLMITTLTSPKQTH